jgi:hypothetical protein
LSAFRKEALNGSRRSLAGIGFDALGGLSGMAMTGRSLWVEVRTETCPLFAFAKKADKYQSGYVRSSEVRRAISLAPYL